MKFVRALLLLFMGFVVLLMLSCPGLQDSKWRLSASKAYFEAARADEAGSTVETRRRVDVAKLKLEEAKRLDRKQMFIFELVMIGILVMAGFGFVRAGQTDRRRAVITHTGDDERALEERG
jgi:hypothetical protein